MNRSGLFTIATVLAAVSYSAHGADLYGVTYAGATDLYSVNQSNGDLTSIGATGFDNLGDLTSDTRPGSQHIYAIRIASNELLELNPITGAGTVLAPLNSRNDMVSIAFDPVSGKLYGNTSVGFGAAADTLYEIDPVTGNTTPVGAIGFDNVFALAFDQSGNLFGIADATDDLVSINTATGAGTFIGDVPLGASFDIASRPEDNVMFLADSGTASLYTINTGTGAVTPVGDYGSPANVVGLAFLGERNVPDGGATGMLMGFGIASLALLKRRAAK